MELITSHYVPPKSVSYGHVPRSKDLTVLARQVEAVLTLIIPQVQHGSLIYNPKSKKWSPAQIA
jgi:hypothetical protein